MALQFRRYPRSQIFAFDFGGSIRAAALAMGGDWHDLGGALFTSLATPSRGATDNSVWKVEILPGTPATPHSLTREEVFVVLEGTASVRIAGNDGQAGA